ncbi:MAG: hypothetical protein J0M24_26965 [Verrucomicrobia bacterium]|nr:hypothetical protein [Verrucomicrobiota bacterium]
MTEEDYIAELRSRWPRQHSDEVSLATIALADEAVRDFPSSARLWVMRGDLLQLGPELCPHPSEDALASYRRAIKADPLFAEAWDEIYHYYDLIVGDEEAAQPFFLESLRLRSNREAQRVSHEPSPPVSVSGAPVHRTLDSLPVPGSGGGR